MSISVNKLSKLYGTQKALDNVSFDISAGEVVGLLGPNGAGKSTMMKILTCFIPPTSGKAFVSGYDIYDQSLEVRKKVGYLPENNPLYVDLYVKEYLEFVSGIYKIPNKRERISAMIDMTGLGGEQKKKIGQLSKGYRQRIGLAQALIHDPEVLILDEPTSGLDPNQLLDIRQLIKSIGKEKTIMLSTHIMQEVEAVCDRAIIIDKGKIVADDTTSNLATKTMGLQVITVEFNKKPDEASLNTINGVKKVNMISEKIWEIQAESDIEIREAIFQYAVNNNLSVLSMQKTTKGLEEVFQQLTNNK